jgi:hypothetical protein
MTLEIIIPLRNPTEVLDKSIESLIAQTDGDFSVLISDNHSTKGQEHIARAVDRLARSGLPVRKIEPPMELGRVEHWNWAHYQSSGDWLKPLFVGDWLEPGYVARVHEIIAAHASCRFIHSNYFLHQHGVQEPRVLDPSPWSGRVCSPAEMQQVVLCYGMQFGPPSGVAYERTAFVALGGYSPALPITADCLFFCTMAARFGAMGIPERLMHFNIHANRFSTQLPQVRRETLQETYTFVFALAYHAWTENAQLPLEGFLRLLARTFKNYLTER